MREESIKHKQAKMAEEYDKAKQVVDEYRRSMIDRKRQVSFFLGYKFT